MTDPDVLRTLAGVLFMVTCVIVLWIGSGPARDERRKRKAKR